ncbi:MAG: Uma2 family endonuclease [Acidobacteria bacterium]|nr:Uma2 family endonuclease [Acidobacteriota bacterium]
MPAVVEAQSAQLPPGMRRGLTREDCRVLQSAGVLELEKFELIDGELIPRMGKSPLHSVVLHHFLQWLRQVFGSDYVQQEISIDLNSLLNRTNEPEPDATVLRRPADCFRAVNPGPNDIHLVVEISVSTREYDLGAKAALYAQAGITEYWVLDLRDRCIVVHREPTGERYGSIVAYAADEAVAPLAAETASIRLEDLA